MNLSPTHEEISHRAHKIWQDGGDPTGNANDHWLEAERQLHARAARPEPHPASSEHAAPHALTELESPRAVEKRAALQKKTARAPKLPHHTGPKQVPAETGKPLWDRPHSS